MELPCRASGDILLPPGEPADIRRRLRRLSAGKDLTTVIACAFDHRTRMLPFIGPDVFMAPAGVRAIGSALLDSGLIRTRIVLQQWNRNFRPSQMRLDGRVPDLFCVSAMQMHFGPCVAMIRDACRIDPACRPLIIAGGPKALYEPWDLFSVDPADPWGADVVVTGEEYVLLALLEVLLTEQSGGEPLRNTFARCRDAGLLGDIPGLVYARGSTPSVAEELVDTGLQRLAGNLDDHADPVLGYRILERPGLRSTLASTPLPPGRVRKHSRLCSIVLTLGCRFGCPYCPIPAYNQRQFRTKSGERIAEEIERIYREYHIRVYFGADDNFFNDHQRTMEIVEALSRRALDGSRPLRKARIATEATVHDTLQMADHLRQVRQAGICAVWMGVEDMTGTLVKKGQSVDKTTEAFRLLQANGIMPMPMMMHHDGQPLWTWRGNYGLLNQVRLLRKAGAVQLQALMLTPSPGSKLFDETYTSGLAYAEVDGRKVEPYMVDGNRVVASRHPRPWRMQMNLLLAYLYFYNPLRMLTALLLPKGKVALAPADYTEPGAPAAKPPGWKSRLRHMLRARLGDAIMQLLGMWGLSHTVARTFGWGLRLMRGKIRRTTAVPYSKVPFRAPDGGVACHALGEEARQSAAGKSD